MGLSPRAEWFDLKIGKWVEDVRGAFTEFTKGKPEWEQVLKVLPGKTNAVAEPQLDASANDDISYLPQIVHGVDVLATKEGASLEFERKVNIAFRILGFHVYQLGQGTGRNIDGIALDMNNRYAIFIDAKSRREGYSLGTDDRTFVEYIKAWQDKLQEKGMTHLFLGIVSSRFKSINQKAISNIKRETSVRAVNMISVEQLLKLVVAKVKFPTQFNLGKLKEILVTDGELNSESLAAWIESMNKSYSANTSL